MSKPNLQSFDEDTELKDNDLLKTPEMTFYATGDDGKVIKLHDRMASVPIGFGGKEFQKQLEEQMKHYNDEEIMALAPFELIGRGIAGIDEMAKAMDDARVLFGLLQIQIGDGTFARYKNIFIHFQGEKMKVLHRAKANRRLGAAKELIGHTHAPLVVSNQASFTVEFIFNELKRVFVSDSIDYTGSGKKQDINTLRIDYQKRMEQAKREAEEERKRLEQERLKMEEEAKQRALEEEKRRLEELKREAEEKKREMEMEKKRKAEEERRIRHEKEEKERAERKRIKQEEEKKEIEEEVKRELKKNPSVNVEVIKENLKRVKKKKRRKRRKKKKDDWSDDKPWTPQRVLAAIHAQISPVNWGLFKPSQKEVIATKWGHGSLNELRAELKPDQVQYGMMRLSFGAGRFRRSHWVYFLWTPDTMSMVHKKNNKRMKHVSYNGKMQELLAPWTLSFTVETLEKVTMKDWIFRVKKTVVVDGDDDLFTEEAFKKALEEENKWIEHLKEKEKEIIEKQKKEEEQKKIEEMKEATRRRRELADRKQSNIFSRVQLNQTDSNTKDSVLTPTQDKDGNYYVDHGVDYEAIKAQKEIEEKEREKEKEEEMARFRQQSVIVEVEEDEYEDSSDEPREPSPEPVIELTTEELAALEEERKRKEAEELAKRTENEIKYRRVLQAKMVLESVELVKRSRGIGETNRE